MWRHSDKLLSYIMHGFSIQIEQMTLCLTQGNEFMSISLKQIKCVLFVLSGTCYALSSVTLSTYAYSKIQTLLINVKLSKQICQSTVK